ncbi:MAG: hypothetical protein K2Q09_06915, partial [Phycisphaerales bacterium]|nr:hypothetical protein [Phycisphaerales bacterium]
VSMQADNTAKRTTTTSMLPDGKGSVAVLENTSEDKQGDRSAPQGGGQPGVVSNVTADATGGAGAGGAAGTSHSNKKEVFKVGIGQKVVDEFAPGGMPTRVSVMVSLSREYIVNLVRTKAASAGGAAGGAGGGAGGGVANQPNEPTQAEIDGAFLKEKERLEKDLASLVQTIAKEPDASNLPRVTVSMIPVAQLGLAGMGSGMGGMPGASMASVGATAGLVGQLATGPVVRTAFLGLLAFVALGMMLMLVRKSSKPQNLPSPEELAGLPPVIDAGDDVVGEADEGATAMVGIELGESQIKTKKMLESIEELVKKNPNDGANLLNRWLNVER